VWDEEAGLLLLAGFIATIWDKVCKEQLNMLPAGLGAALLCVLFHATFIISIFDV
jgi:hypothetical protein